MDAISARQSRIAAIREFGPNRVAEGIMRLCRADGLAVLTDEAQQALLEQLEADWRFSERLNAESRNRAAAKSSIEAALNPGPTVKAAQDEIERLIYERLAR